MQPPNPHNPNDVPLDKLPEGWRYLDVSETKDQVDSWVGGERMFKSPAYMDEVMYYGPIKGEFFVGVTFSPFYLKYTTITNAPLPAHLAAKVEPTRPTRWPQWDKLCQ